MKLPLIMQIPKGPAIVINGNLNIYQYVINYILYAINVIDFVVILHYLITTLTHSHLHSPYRVIW